MKAVVFEGGRARFVGDRRPPVPVEGESLVRVELAAVCSTDREILRGYRPDFSGVMGHEFVGVVEAEGTEGAGGALAGRRVVGEINLDCGACLYCTSGRPRHCARRATLGINGKDGSFAEFLTLPTRLLHPVPEGLAPEEAVYTEPLAAALRITEQTDIADGMPVGILGDGRLALMVCQALAATTGARLTVRGRHPGKLALFAPYADVVRTGRRACGAQGGSEADEGGEADPAATQGAPTGGGPAAGGSTGADPADRPAADEPAADAGFEVVIDATGSPAALAEALALTRSAGTLVMKSTYAGTTEIDMSEVVVREIRIQGSRCGSFGPALALLRSGRVALPPIELHPPEDFEAAFSSPAFKAALDFR
ncbi:MAG: alcohol dehydrogenase catalytic domain-containing protein [Coriobacteriales bacterium]|jgi:threonine dehydrogenase-like Zn-dependent dehydrogenase|nr:alcohol dehydrogenase catalytic domain-containing protein [Coriobacteriales bacterium]